MQARCPSDLLTGRWRQLGQEIEQMRLLTDADGNWDDDYLLRATNGICCPSLDEQYCKLPMTLELVFPHFSVPKHFIHVYPASL